MQTPYTALGLAESAADPARHLANLKRHQDKPPGPRQVGAYLSRESALLRRALNACYFAGDGDGFRSLCGELIRNAESLFLDDEWKKLPVLEAFGDLTDIETDQRVKRRSEQLTPIEPLSHVFACGTAIDLHAELSSLFSFAADLNTHSTGNRSATHYLRLYGATALSREPSPSDNTSTRPTDPSFDNLILAVESIRDRNRVTFDRLLGDLIGSVSNGSHVGLKQGRTLNPEMIMIYHLGRRMLDYKSDRAPELLMEGQYSPISEP